MKKIIAGAFLGTLVLGGIAAEELKVGASVSTGAYFNFKDMTASLADYENEDDFALDASYSGEKAGFKIAMCATIDPSSSQATFKLSPSNIWLKCFDGKVKATAGYLKKTNAWKSPVWGYGASHYDYGMQLDVNPISNLTVGSFVSFGRKTAAVTSIDDPKFFANNMNYGAKFSTEDGVFTVNAGYGKYKTAGDNAWLGATINPIKQLSLQPDFYVTNAFGVNDQNRGFGAAAQVIATPIDALNLQATVEYAYSTSKVNSILEYLKASYKLNDTFAPFIDGTCQTKDLTAASDTTDFMIQPGIDITIDNMTVSAYYTYSTLADFEWGYYAMNEGSSFNLYARISL